jgi:hypothetical protein
MIKLKKENIQPQTKAKEKRTTLLDGTAQDSTRTTAVPCPKNSTSRFAFSCWSAQSLCIFSF